MATENDQDHHIEEREVGREESMREVEVDLEIEEEETDLES